MPQTNSKIISHRSITLTNDVQEVPRLNVFVDEVCEDMGCDMETTMRMNLAIEEAVVNVIDYAYPSGTVGSVDINVTVYDNHMEFVISDSGTPFDPTKKEDVDISLPVEERRIGGLGIHLVKQLMDKISYERKDGRNVLTLIKNK